VATTKDGSENAQRPQCI